MARNETSMPLRVSAAVALHGDGRPLEEGFRDGNGAPADGTEAIFPIVQIGHDSWRPVGTGFFISNNGLFATAKHVLRDAWDRAAESLFGLHVSRSGGTVTAREIQRIVCHPRADVAIGFLFDKRMKDLGIQTENKLFRLTKVLPRTGDRVVSFAWPNAVVEPTSDGQRLKIASLVSQGVFDEFLPNGRDRSLLPGPCFRTSMPVAPGASGGPVAYGDGAVFGINSTGWDGTEMSFISPASALLDLAITNVKLPDGSIRGEVALSELAELGLIGLQ